MKKNKKINVENLNNRTKGAIFLVLYWLIIISLILLSDASGLTIKYFGDHKYLPFIFFNTFLLLNSVIIYFISKEINQTFLPKHSLLSNLFIFFIISMFTLGNIYSYILVPYGFISDTKQIRIIFAILSTLSIATVYLIMFIYFLYYKIGLKKSLYGALCATIVIFFLISFCYLSILRYVYLIILLFIIPVINDTFAYFGGNFFGNHKMCANLSKNKTWEGFFTGIIFSIITAIIFILMFFINAQSNLNKSILWSMYGWQINNICYDNFFYDGKWWVTIISSILILNIISPFSDLLFSKFKRVCQVKDFSNLIKGHGGILDRIDSLSLVFVSYFFISLIINVSLSNNLLQFVNICAY